MYGEADSGGRRSYEIQFFSTNLHRRLNFTRLEILGIDKVIYRVFQDRQKDGGLYFYNTQFNTLSPLLEELIPEFKATAIDLCAWMIGRKFEWISDTSLFDYTYENGGLHMVRKLDIFNPDAVKKIVTVFKELASHKIDCILIQDDFMLRYNEGFSNWGRAQFAGAAGVPAKEKLMMSTGTPYNQNWKKVKTERLVKLLKVIVRSCKSINSALKVGMNIYYEAPLRVEDAEAWYGHNLSEIAGTDLDYIYLMSYHRQIKDEMKLSESKNRELFKRITARAYDICKEKLIVKIQLRDWSTGLRIPVEEVRAYLDLVPPQVKRVCFTPVTVNDYEYLAEIIGGAAKDAKNRKGKEGD